VRLHASLTAAALVLALPVRSVAAGDPPGGPVIAASLGGGAEAGLPRGRRAGVMDGEGLAGWDLLARGGDTGLVLRPEVALSLGLAPDFHLALRPGVRVALPGMPIWLRAAADWSGARGSAHWRWLLLGVAWEARITGLLGLFVEADTGVPLTSGAGLPLLVRAGATFRP
jgi:hypothetical protein